MLALLAAALAGQAAFALAQDSTSSDQSATSTTSSASATYSAEYAVHTVTAANDGSFNFVPQSLNAIPGDIIVFEVDTGNHSVIRSTYGYPCVPYEDITGGQGFYSGWLVPENSSTPARWNVTVNDTNPIWYYCGAPGSCIGHAMLGVINIAADQELSTQVLLSSEANYMLEPGQPMPQNVKQSMSQLAATATTVTVTASPTTATTSAVSTTAAAASGGRSGSSLSAGAIAGIAVGGAVVLIGLALLFWYIGRHKSMKDEIKNLRKSTGPNSEMQGGASSALPQGIVTYAGEDNKHQSQLPPYHPQEYYKSPMSPPIVESMRFSPNPDRFTRFSEASELRAEPISPHPGAQPQNVAHELYTPRESEFPGSPGLPHQHS